MEDVREDGVNHALDIDLNYPFVASMVSPLERSINVDKGMSVVHCPKLPVKRKRSRGDCMKAKDYQDMASSRGRIVKASGVVLRVCTESRRRRPNVIRRVETFGKIVGSFDERRRKWVHEMGFGGLLHLVEMHLPRDLCYWLMTRIDPENEMLNVGGKHYRLSSVQVRWILGLPKCEQPVPMVYTCESGCRKVIELEEKYGQVWTSVDSRSGKVVRRKGISVSTCVVEKLMSQFEDEDADEFKMLFLMAARDMVLCPTQCSRFSRDLLPALNCAKEAKDYNWCALVLEKLMASVKRFGRRFYTHGFAGGCGGCTLFVAVGCKTKMYLPYPLLNMLLIYIRVSKVQIFYLDRLNRNALQWGTRPRVKVWNDKQMEKACDDDRCSVNREFGCAGVVDVANGEKHPLDARDLDFSSDDEGSV